MSPEVGEGPGGSPQSPVVSILVQHLVITTQSSSDQVPLEPLVMLFRNNNNSSLDRKKKKRAPVLFSKDLHSFPGNTPLTCERCPAIGDDNSQLCSPVQEWELITETHTLCQVKVPGQFL